MRDDELVAFRRPLPLGPVLEGAMVDGHVVAAVTPQGASRIAALAHLDGLPREGPEAAAEAGGDVGVLARSLFAYEAQGLTPKASKRVRFETGHADVWGAIAFHTRTDDKCFHQDLAFEIKFQKELPVTVIMSQDMEWKDGRNRKENLSAKEMGITYLDPQPETR